MYGLQSSCKFTWESFPQTTVFMYFLQGIQSPAILLQSSLTNFMSGNITYKDCSYYLIQNETKHQYKEQLLQKSAPIKRIFAHDFDAGKFYALTYHSQLLTYRTYSEMEGQRVLFRMKHPSGRFSFQNSWPRLRQFLNRPVFGVPIKQP